MTNTIAWMLAALIVGILCVDIFYFGWDLHIFLFRKMNDLIEWMAFWR